MTRVAYFDCFSGASGDMILGALLDAGLSMESLQEELSKIALPEGAFSIEAWVRSDSGGEIARPTIVERIDQVEGASFGYRVSRPPATAGAFELFRGGETFTTAGLPVRFAGYSHTVAVVRAGEMILYADGRATTTAIADAPATPLIGPLVVGASRTGAGAFHGAIDEIAIYDYPLDADQIARHRAAATEPR